MEQQYFKGIDEFDNIIWVSQNEHYQFFLTKHLAKQTIYTFALDAVVKKDPDNAVWYIFRTGAIPKL